MREIDCARYEAELAAMLAEAEGADPERTARLRAHAASCPACRGSEDLLRLAETPAALRDPIPDPPEETWARLARGIESGIARERRRLRLLRVGVVAAAAAVVLVALLLRVPGPAEPIEEISEAAASQAGPEDPGPLPGAWDGWDDFAYVPETEDPKPAAVPSGGMYPDVDDLDEGTRERLLRWLREEEARLSEGGPA